MSNESVAPPNKLIETFPVLSHVSPGTRVFIINGPYAGLYGEVKKTLFGQDRSNLIATHVEVVIDIEAPSPTNDHYKHLEGQPFSAVAFSVRELAYELEKGIYHYSDMRYHISRKTTLVEKEDYDKFYSLFKVRVHAYGSEELRVNVEDTDVDGKKFRTTIGKYSDARIYGDSHHEMVLHYAEDGDLSDLENMTEIATAPEPSNPENLVSQLVVLFKGKDISTEKKVTDLLFGTPFFNKRFDTL